MGIPRVATCCCGCTLEAGTKIIGCMEVIFMIIAISISAWALSLLDAVNSNLDQSDVDILYGVFVTCIVVYSIQLCISILLLVGASQRKPGLMKPWLVFAAIDLLMTLVLMIVNSIVYASSGNSGAIGSTVSSTLLNILLKIYYIIVVYSFYREMNEGAVAVGGMTAGYGGYA